MAELFDFSQPIKKDINLYAMWNCSTFDPAEPTLDNLVAALETGNPSAFYPVGTLIPDTYNNYTINWRVVHYGKALLATGGDPVDGVFLMTAEGLDSLGMSADTWLETQAGIGLRSGGAIYTKLSAKIKSLVSVVQMSSVVNAAVGSSRHSTGTRTDAICLDGFFPPSIQNLGFSAATPETPTNFVFSYFSDGSNAKRVIGYYANGNTYAGWATRDFANQYNSTVRHFHYVYTNGTQAYLGQTISDATAAMMVTPCCFIQAP